MRRRCGIFALTVLALCLGTVSALAQATSSLRGKVADAQGGALPGVTVDLSRPAEANTIRTVVTDGTGRYRIEGVPAGTHTLVLWNETIEPETRQVTVPDGGEVEVNLTVAAPPAPK